MKNNFKDLSNTSFNLNAEINNLISSYNDDDESRKLYHQKEMKYSLRRLIDAINISDVLPNYILQIKFAKRYDFSNKEPVSLTNF